MKQLFAIICLLCVALCRGNPAAASPAEPAPCRWEIVSELYLGVQTAELTPTERDAMGRSLSRRQGLKVVGIAPDSPAERAGLQVGDYILKYNGARTASPEDLLLAMRNTKPGEYGHFDIMRAGKRIPMRVKLGALPRPRVLGYVTFTPGHLPQSAAWLQHQKELALLLSAEAPDVAAIRAAVRRIHSAFPSEQRTGSLRLYYHEAAALFAITAYPDKIEVTLYLDQSKETHYIRQQGDSLPPHARKLVRQGGGQ